MLSTHTRSFCSPESFAANEIMSPSPKWRLPLKPPPDIFLTSMVSPRSRAQATRLVGGSPGLLRLKHQLTQLLASAALGASF